MGSGLPGSVPGPEGCDAGTHSISVPQRSVRPLTGVPLPVTLSHAPSRYQRQGPTHDRLTVLHPGFLMSGGVRARRTSVYLKRVLSGCRCHRTLWAERGQERAEQTGAAVRIRGLGWGTPGGGVEPETRLSAAGTEPLSDFLNSVTSGLAQNPRTFHTG